MEYDFDLFVIGGGSGGVRAARLAAEKGLRVGMAEGDRMGGTCVIRGCVPKKLMLFASEFGAMVKRAEGFGWSHKEGAFGWKGFQEKLSQELDRLEGVYTGIMERNKVRLFEDYAAIDGAHHVTLDSGLRFSAERILIATGGRPFVPEFEGRDLVLTSDDVFHLDSLPKRLAVVGGGYVASEFAGIFKGMGVDVTQIYRGDMILRGYDMEVREAIVAHMRDRGMNVLLDTDVAKVEASGAAKVLTLSSGETLKVDEVLYATGRVANYDELGLDEVGVAVERGAIKVDEFSQTSVPSIYAIGDVTGRAALTPVAIREAVNFIKTVYEDTPTSINYDLIPTAIFTRPEFGTVGLSEEKAIEQGFDVDIFATSFTPMSASFAGVSEKMMMKLVVNKADDKVLGVHILGEGAGEMIQLIAVAVTMGAKKADLDATIAVHPTASEELVTMKTPR